MGEFLFRGRIPSSKSLYNRSLIVADYFPELKLHGESQSEDVIHMRSGLEQLHRALPVECGEGGTTFRFLALRASRIPGRHTLKGSSRLFSRPHTTLLKILNQLGVECDLQENHLTIHSQGWKKPSHNLVLSLKESSQFASGLFLNSWNLDFDLPFFLTDATYSRSYLDLTLNLLQSLGMEIAMDKMEFNKGVIPARQKVKLLEYQVEPDLSSAFSMAAAGALKAPVEILDFPFTSSQPDLAFVEILKKMGVGILKRGDSLVIEPATELKNIECDLSQCPDLFPVLSVVCAFAAGRSRLYGAPQLVSKESDRIAKTKELLNLMGVEASPTEDGIVIQGQSHPVFAKFSFDPDQDHRMAMAAGLVSLKGYAVRILNPECLGKSFPEFFDWIGVHP